MEEIKSSRFIDVHYNELFQIPDGEKVVLTDMDGIKRAFPCRRIDDYHVVLEGYTATHICELAERFQRAGVIYAPEHPKPGDCLDTYEIYQILHTRAVEYGFCSYDVAKKHFRSEDYTRMYAGVLAPKVTMQSILKIHNMDSRPFGRKMRSLSKSDVVVLHRGGTRTAYYMNGINCIELPQFVPEKAQAEKAMPATCRQDGGTER